MMATKQQIDITRYRMLEHLKVVLDDTFDAIRGCDSKRVYKRMEQAIKITADLLEVSKQGRLTE